MKPSKYRNQRVECSIDDCVKAVRARGLCSSHYQRWLIHGNPCAGRTRDGEPSRFLNEVVFSHSGGDCLLWPYGRYNTGYGCVVIDGKRFLVHRLSCEKEHGPPPSAKHEAGHLCGVRLCCNRKHLRWVSRSENQMDRVGHGTHKRGERAWNAKLSTDQAKEIKATSVRVPETELARIYGVSRTTIADIRHGRTWGWL